MKDCFRSSIGVIALAIASFQGLNAQTNSRDVNTPMTDAEIRQVLVDLGTYLDAHRGTTLASQFEAIPADQMSRIAASIPNPAQLKASVAGLKEHDAAVTNGTVPRTRANAISQGVLATPAAVVGNCAPNTIIDNSPGSPCTPSYPDPTNTSWQSLVNPLLALAPGAFSPTDYPSISQQQCGLTVESNLVQVVSALNGTVTVASIGCSALQAIPVAGTVAAGVCDAGVAIVGTAGAVSQGLLADCSEQDGNVNSAEIDAGFHNTVTIYNALGGLGTQLSGQLTNVQTQIDNMLNTDNGGITNLINGLSTNLSTDVSTLNANLSNNTNTLNTNLLNYTNAINTNLSNDNAKITSEFATASTQLTNVNNTITGEFGTVTNQFAAISTQLNSIVQQLTNQIAATTELLNADMRQTWKLEMTPDGQKVLNPAMLTCTGADCPNVLARCPAAGCSWNNVGPLP